MRAYLSTDCDKKTTREVDMKSILTTTFALALLCSAQLASADCACICVEGEAKTLCDALGDAQANPSACQADTGNSNCPAIENPGSTPVDPPEGAEGAAVQNCRSVRVWDPATRGYTSSANICDLADA